MRGRSAARASRPITSRSICALFHMPFALTTLSRRPCFASLCAVGDSLRMSAMLPKLSIVIPAFNEAARVERSIRKIVDYLRERRENGELIVVDDGSQDDTSTIAENVARDSEHVVTRVIRYADNRGKGYAVRLGLLEAQANIALFSDADLSTPVTETQKLIDPIR